PPTLRPTARPSATTAPSKDRSSSSSTRRPRCLSEPSPTSSSTTTTSATTRASATSPPPMSTTAAGTRSWPKERRSQTGPYSNDGTTIGPAGSERRPPRCPLTKGPKSPKVADDVHCAGSECGQCEARSCHVLSIYSGAARRSRSSKVSCAQHNRTALCLRYTLQCRLSDEL